MSDAKKCPTCGTYLTGSVIGCDDPWHNSTGEAHQTPADLLDECARNAAQYLESVRGGGELAILRDAFRPMLDALVQAQRERDDWRLRTSHPWTRDQLGSLVRLAWIKWVQTQLNPKPWWLVQYAELAECDKEADRKIGEFIENSCVNLELLRVEADRDAALARATQAESALAAQAKELEALRTFASRIMENWPEGDIDGGDLQEIAISTGMLEGRTVTEPCGDHCSCAEWDTLDAQHPQTCYRPTAILRAAQPRDGGTGSEG